MRLVVSSLQAEACDVDVPRDPMPMRNQDEHGTLGDVDLDEVADELYGLVPGEFVAARQAREKEARASGERDLASHIRALAKPSTVAWLANQLVRARPDEVGALLDLGGEMREATAVLSGDDLRRLSVRQQRLVSDLVSDARALAETSGQRVTDTTSRGLEETLRAAMADEAQADQLASGRLTDALQHVGFGTGGDTVPRPRPSQTRVRATEPSRTQHRVDRESAKPERADTRPSETRRSEQVERARQDADQALEKAERAQADLEQAQSEMDEAKARASELAERVARMREELSRTAQEQHDADREARQAEVRWGRAERAAGEARRRLETSTSRLDRLRMR